MSDTNKIPPTPSTNPINQSYGAIIRAQFKKNRMAVWSFRILLFFVFVAIFGNFLANEKPLYCKIDGKTYFPVLKQQAVDLGLSKVGKFIDWKAVKDGYESKIMPPIPYAFYTKDFKHTNTSPFDKQNLSWRYRHWCGTDLFGRDILAGLINGTRTALLTGIIAMSIASFIGIFFGGIAGYFHDDRLKVSPIRLFLNCAAFVLGLFYGFMARAYIISEGSFFEIIKGVAIFSIILYMGNIIAHFIEKIPFFNKKITLPVDTLVMRLVEIMNSIPGLLILLSVIAILKQPSIFNIMVIIGLISWTGIARFVRAEFLRIRKLAYIEAARALGFKEWRIILKHALPNAIGPVFIAISFGIAGAILAEATLSFLGIGVQATVVTWGSMLHDARSESVKLWWLMAFPGFAIFMSVTIFNVIGEGLREAISAK